MNLTYGVDGHPKIPTSMRSLKSDPSPYDG